MNIIIWCMYSTWHRSLYRVGLCFFFWFLFFSFLFRAAPVAYGSSQARGQIRAAAAGLHHRHSNAGSEPHLWPLPGNARSLTHQVSPVIKPIASQTPCWMLNLLSHNGNSLCGFSLVSVTVYQFIDGERETQNTWIHSSSYSKPHRSSWHSQDEVDVSVFSISCYLQ